MDGSEIQPQRHIGTCKESPNKMNTLAWMNNKKTKEIDFWNQQKMDHPIKG